MVNKKQINWLYNFVAKWCMELPSDLITDAYINFTDSFQKIKPKLI